MSKKCRQVFQEKNRGGTPSVAAPGVTYPSDATAALWVKEKALGRGIKIIIDYKMRANRCAGQLLIAMSSHLLRIFNYMPVANKTGSNLCSRIGRYRPATFDPVGERRVHCTSTWREI